MVKTKEVIKKPVANESQKAAYDLIEIYRDDPAFYIESKLGLRLWSGMRYVIETVWNNKRTTVRACHGISKTKVASALAVTYLNLYDDAIVVTTAPTNRQVEKLLWKEIREIYMRKGSDLRGVCLQVEIKCKPDSYLIGFATDNATKIEGWHSAHILFILDEAKGIGQWVYDALEGSMSGRAKMLEISTTDGADQQCPFRQHHNNKRREWKCINFSAWDSPFINPAKVKKEYMKHLNKKLFKYGKKEDQAEWPVKLKDKIQIVDDTEINSKENSWKEDRPELWACKIIGDFWEQGTDNIIPLSWIMSAVNAEVDNNGPWEFGQDVARFGDDRSVLTEKKGKTIYPQQVWGKKDTMETVGIIANAMLRRYIYVESTVALAVIKVDADGIGSGVFDRLAELGYAVYGLMSAKRAINDVRFYNYRSEMWFHARAVFKRQYDEGNVLSIPDDDELIEELSGMKYKIHSDGREIAEPKEDYKKRSGKSPDKGDSFIYCIAPVEPVIVDSYQEAEEEEGWE